MGKNTIANGRISGPIAKMIELPKHYVINGAVYNKDDTSPVPKSFFMMPTISNESTLKETAYLSEGNSKRIGIKSKRTYLVDRKDTNITYVVGNTYANGGDGRTLFKLKETNGVFEIMWNVVPGTVAYPESFDIVDDDDNYIYVSGHNLEYGHHYIRRFSKKDGAVTAIYLATSSNNKCVEYFPSIINGKIYASMSWYANASAYAVGALAIVNLADFTVSYVTTPKVDFTTCISQYSQITRVDDTLVWYGIYNSQELWKMTYDLTVGAMTNVKACDIPVPYKTGAVNGYTGDIHVDIRVNKDYIIISQRTVAVNYATAPIADRTLLLFKIAGDGTVTFADSMIVDFPYRNSLLADSDDMIYVFDKFKINVISVTADRKLLKVSTLTPSYLTMLGRDNVGNIFIISEDTSISVFNRKIPAIIDVVFEKSSGSYEYNGKDNILTYMEVKMYNHVGAGVSGVVTVELIGPAVFTDGTRKKTVSVDGSLQIPIIIAGYGEISYSVVND